MIDDPHIGFVVAAYALAFATILAMILSTTLEHRALKAHLDQASRALESARGAQAGEKA